MKNYLSTAIIGISIIIGLLVLANAYKYKFKSSETISVTGLAEKDFTSDLIVWGGSFSRSDKELKKAHGTLKQDELAIKSYLNAKGIPDSSIVFSAVSITKNFQRHFDQKGNEISSEFTDFTLTENLRLESKDIERVEKLSREITTLLENGIELNSNAPEFYYTRLNELKIVLLAKASEDAKTRANTIANNSGGSLKGIKNATMGVFQITGKNQNEDYSYGGSFNTSSKEKTASITLKVDYLVR
jgi:hypothetical protein